MPILQLRIELLHIEPLIWRRIQVSHKATWWDLHVERDAVASLTSQA